MSQYKNGDNCARHLPLALSAPPAPAKSPSTDTDTDTDKDTDTDTDADAETGMDPDPDDVYFAPYADFRCERKFTPLYRKFPRSFSRPFERTPFRPAVLPTIAAQPVPHPQLLWVRPAHRPRLLPSSLLPPPLAAAAATAASMS